ncbi:MAG: hypothetical protein WCJ16_08190 [Actinomycetes bacterium]|jgi:hypothetical protein
MKIKFTQSARKHRIGKARAMYVIENFSFTIITGEDDEKIQRVWVAKDNRGLELEIVAVVLEDYLLVTHVMPTDLRRGKNRWPQK